MPTAAATPTATRDAEAEYQNRTQRHLLDLQAEQQHGDGRRAGNQPAGQAEQDHLAGTDVAAGETTANVVGVGPLVRILVALQRQLQTLQLRMGVVVRMELQVVLVGVSGVAEAQARGELMRLGNRIQRLQIAVLGDEAELLNLSVAAGGEQTDVPGRPGMPAQHTQTPARRRVLLVDRQFDAAVSGIDVLAFVVMVLLFLEAPHLLATPGAPEHPQRDGNDEHGRGELEVGFGGLGVEVLPQVHAADRHQPDHGGVRGSGRQAKQDGLTHRAANGHDEGRHHGLRVPGFQAMQGPEQDGGGDIQPGLCGPLLQQLGEGRHGGSEVFGDLLELFQWRPLTLGKGADRVFQAVVDVVLDQRALGLADRFLDRVQLLGDVHTGATVLYHGDDAAQMALGTFQPFDDFRMTLVLMPVFVLAHRQTSCKDNRLGILSPWGGCGQTAAPSITRPSYRSGDPCSANPSAPR